MFGPDLTYVETLDYSVDPSAEPAFKAYIRKFWPGLPDGALTPDYAGIRPKLHGPTSRSPTSASTARPPMASTAWSPSSASKARG